LSWHAGKQQITVAVAGHRRRNGRVVPAPSEFPATKDIRRDQGTADPVAMTNDATHDQDALVAAAT